MSTPTPCTSGRSKPAPGPVRVLVCVLFLAGLRESASRAGFGAPHLSCGRCSCLLCFLSPLRAGVALFLFVSPFCSLFSFFSAAVVLGFRAFFCFRPRVCPPPFPCFFPFFCPCCPLSFFFQSVFLCGPALCPCLLPLPSLLFFVFDFSLPSLLFSSCSFFLGGGLLARACVLPCLLPLPCCVACCSFWLRVFPCCVVLCGGCGAAPPLPSQRPLPWLFMVFLVSVAPFVLFMFCGFLFLVVLCPRLWVGPLCGVCTAVLCRGGVVVVWCAVRWLDVWSRCLLSCVVACCGFFICSVRFLCAVLFGVVLRFDAVSCVWCCAAPGRFCVRLSGSWLGCVLLCCGFVLCCGALLYVVRLCRAGLWRPPPSLCCDVSCSGVPPCAVLCGSFCCCVSVVCCPVSCPGAASLAVALLCPVALLVVRCAIPPCVVFRGASCAVMWCAVLACLRRVSLCCVPLWLGRWLVPSVAAYIWGSAGEPGCPVLSSGGVFRRCFPCRGPTLGRRKMPRGRYGTSRPAATPEPHRQHKRPLARNTPQVHAREHAPRSRGHRTHNTPHTPHNTPSVPAREQGPRDPRHHRHHRTHPAGIAVNRSQVARDTAHTTQHKEQAQR